MAAAVGAKIAMAFPEARLWNVTAGAAANVTITHGLGIKPRAVIVQGIATTTYGAVLVSYDATTIVLYLENGASADVIAILGR